MNVLFKNSSERGSILLALLISSFALVVVLALCTLSSLNINVVRSQVEYSQFLLTAQAAVSQFLYELDSYQTQNSEGVDVSSPHMSYDLKTRYQKFPVFYNTRSEFPAQVSISFDDTKSYYSTDNSLSENPAVGWGDRGGAVTTVPPFSINLLINVGIGSSKRHFGVIVCRTWPYVAFCEKGSICITSTTSSGNNPESLYYSPSIIRGNLFSISSILLGLPDSQDCKNLVLGNLYTTRSKLGGISYALDDPLYIHEGNFLKGKKEYGVLSCVFPRGGSPIDSFRFPEKKVFKELTPQEFPQLEVVGSATELSLGFYYNNHLGGSQETCLAWAGSNERMEEFQKKVDSYYSTYVSTPQSLPDEVCEFIEDYIEQNFHGDSGFTRSHKILKAVNAYVQKICFGNSYFLKENLVLQGTETNNKFYIQGNIANHFIKFRGTNAMGNPGSQAFLKPGAQNLIWETYDDKYSKAGIVLKDCTLFIDGNMELLEFIESDNPSIENETTETVTSLSIVGENSALVVSQNLKVVGGNLDSKDKGMVILANNLELSTRGAFQGLILSKGALLINPYPVSMTGDNRLHVTGALACVGNTVNEGKEKDTYQMCLNGLVLKSVDLTLDSRYTKALNFFGKAKVSLWKELK